MSKIPKEIVDKIEQRNKLNEEIETWCKENLDMDGMDPDCADITDHHTGKEQGNDECKEWCEQWSGYEDAEEKDRLGQWIPCSERLPKDRQIVVADIECSIEDRMCIFAYFKIVDHMEHWINANTGFPVLANVVQWTPLPEPYKEEK